jgi:hypothetical protein
MPTLIWGSPHWVNATILLAIIVAMLLLWSYARAHASRSIRALAALLKAVGFGVLIVSLAEPLLTGTQPRRGANVFGVLVDNSQSMLMRDVVKGSPRAEWARKLVDRETAWGTRLSQDFDLRRYAFDSHLRAVDDFASLEFKGLGSALGTSLTALSRRFRGLPLAGVILISDGNRTDLGEVEWSELPPIYPVLPPESGRGRDVGVRQVSVSQTNFEAAPVVIRADVSTLGIAGESIVALVVDEEDKEVDRQQAKAQSDGVPLSFRFQFRPEQKGVRFYRVVAFAEDDEARVRESLMEKPSPKQGTADPGPETIANHRESESSRPTESSPEMTLANNSRLLVVDPGEGPYRVLYLSGRPNWEYKFLRRALADDEQVQLVGLLRVARRQPKFDFRSSRSRSTSQLYDGFDNPDEETAERQNQPVLIRLGTLDEAELRDGFPRSADELYRYHAVILDDLEAEFFTQDQLAMLRDFVSRRGGGFLMLGGPDSFAEGKYDRTPVGEILPVYARRSLATTDAFDGQVQEENEYRLALTREGWLQPWVRLRKTEDEERKRLDTTTPFQTLSRVGPIKPGAVVLAEVIDAFGRRRPALAAQPFGRGRTAALLIGDLWRSAMRRNDPAENDHDRSWRQTVRWLVSDVPGRLQIDIRPVVEAPSPAVSITALVRDAEFRPLDNAKVSLEIQQPNGESLALEALPDGRESGSYSATYMPRLDGGYRVLATAYDPDGSEISRRESGWAAQPTAEEFARLPVDRELLKTIARKTGGETVEPDQLDSFVRSLSSRRAPITEPWISPLWHNPAYFLIAIVCLTAEWGLRRLNGLP